MKSHAFCIFSLACLATPPGFSASLDFSLAADIRYFDYEEFGSSGQSLNDETGFIPGFSIAAGTSSFGLGHTLEFGLWGGAVDYDGRTQSGQPHQTKTDETIYRLLYRADWQPRNIGASLYAKACWQNWDRDIRPANGVSGLFERYQWWTIEAGLRATLWQLPKRSLAFELGLLNTNHGTIMIDLSGDGYGKPTLNLGDGHGAMVSLAYTIESAGNNRLQFAIDYTRWNFGRSNSMAVSNGASTIVITEPDSTSNHITLSAGYNFRF